MSISQIQDVVNENFPEQGKFKRPVALEIQPDSWSFVIDRDDCMFNAAYIRVQLKNGLSVEARFDPD